MPDEITMEPKATLPGLLERVSKAFGVLPDVRRAWVFGSFARGEQTDESDIDIFFTFDGDDERPVALIERAARARASLRRTLTGAYDRDCDLACCSEATFEQGGKPGVYSGILPAIVKSEGVLAYG